MKKSAKSPAKRKKSAAASAEPRTETRGRKGTITAEKSAILLIAIENGLDLKEALVQAEVSDDAYRRLLKKSSVFRGQVAAAEIKLVILAKAGMAKKIQQEDGSMIRWYLERKKPEEFRPQYGEGDVPPGLPAGTIVILPGSHPHPRITPA